MTDATTAPPTDPTAAWVAPCCVSRRQVLVTGGVMVAAVAVTAACGSSGGSGGSGGGPGGSGTTVPTSEVPVGGGTILAEAKVVITQPVAGTYKAFTAVCTHMGCLVASISNGNIVCPCHGSTYSISDGSVTGGPAPRPLAAVPITVSGSTITIT